MTTGSKQSAAALSWPFPWTLWPDATTISNQRVLNGNMANVEGQDVLRKGHIKTTPLRCVIFILIFLILQDFLLKIELSAFSREQVALVYYGQCQTKQQAYEDNMKSFKWKCSLNENVATEE